MRILLILPLLLLAQKGVCEGYYSVPNDKCIKACLDAGSKMDDELTPQSKASGFKYEYWVEEGDGKTKWSVTKLHNRKQALNCSYESHGQKGNLAVESDLATCTWEGKVPDDFSRTTYKNLYRPCYRQCRAQLKHFKENVNPSLQTPEGVAK